MPCWRSSSWSGVIQNWAIERMSVSDRMTLSTITSNSLFSLALLMTEPLSSMSSSEKVRFFIMESLRKTIQLDLTRYHRFGIVFSTSKESEVTRLETLSICKAMCQRIGLVLDGEGNPVGYKTQQTPECYVHILKRGSCSVFFLHLRILHIDDTRLQYLFIGRILARRLWQSGKNTCQT